MSKTAIVVTHNGSFHCDDVLAFALIRYLYGDALPVRTRDEAVIASFVGRDDTFVVDVGGVFDPSRRLYDHHQSTFFESYDDTSNVPLSSSGLVYKYHGEAILGKFMRENFPTMISCDIIPALKKKLYDSWFKHIDANDNGRVPTLPFPILSTIYARVGRMNLSWDHPRRGDHLAIGEAFLRAADLVISEFLDIAKTTVTDHFLTEALVREMMIACPHKDILILDNPCPWKSHINRLEGILGKSYTYVAVPEDPHAPDGRWRLCAIQTAARVNRQVIPTHFKTMAGVTFIHNAGFLAAAISKDACIALGEACMKYFAPTDKDH